MDDSLKVAPTSSAVVHPLLQASFEAEADRLTKTRIRPGNTAELLPSGTESYRLRWKLIAEAQHHIHIVAFSLMRDETSYRLRDVLLEKLQQGVAVRLIFDDAVLYTTFSQGILQDLARRGAEVIRYHHLFRDWVPDWKAGHPFRQIVRTMKLKLKRHFHEKYLIVDGREAILGGINWGNKYAFGGSQPSAWRDSDVYLSGPVVADIQRQFIKDFFRYDAMERVYTARRQSGWDEEAFYRDVADREAALLREEGADLFPPLAHTGEERIRYIPHKPYDDEQLCLTDAYLHMIRQAQTFIYWGCHGIRPPRILAETLAEAVARGVEVHLITNSRRSARTLMANGLLGWMYWECTNHYRWLLERGVKIYEWQKPGAFHSKNCVIDDVAASIGSFNIARGSTLHHTESNVVIYDGDFARRVHQQFEVDLADCREVTLEQAKKVRRRFDPYRRLLHERNLLIERSLLTEAVRNDLDAGRVKRM